MSNKFVPNFAAFRLYEDGTESGSSPIEAQDTDTTARDISSDSQVHLRVRIDETGDGSVAGETTDDWTLEYRLNGGGSWVTITTSSSAVQTDTGSTLSDGSDTTDRATNGISAGTGSFFVGVQEDGNGEITDFQHAADNHTEHVFALLLISSVLADNDALTFRVALNGSNIAAGVVPSITVSTGGSTFEESIALDKAMDLAPVVTTTLDQSIALDKAHSFLNTTGLGFEESIELNLAHDLILSAATVLDQSINLESARSITVVATTLMDESVLLDMAHSIANQSVLVLDQSIVLDAAKSLGSTVGLAFEESIALDLAHSYGVDAVLIVPADISLELAKSLGTEAITTLDESILLDAKQSIATGTVLEYNPEIELNRGQFFGLLIEGVGGGGVASGFKIYHRRRRH